MSKCFVKMCDGKPVWMGDYRGREVLICHNDRWRVPLADRSLIETEDVEEVRVSASEEKPSKTKVFELPKGAESMCAFCLSQATHFIVVTYSYGSLKPACTLHAEAEEN